LQWLSTIAKLRQKPEKEEIMIRRLALLIAVILLAMTAHAKVNLAAEQAAVKAVLDNYVKSIVQEDMALYEKILSHDTTVMYFGTSEAPILGWQALKPVIEAQNAALSNTTIDVTDTRIRFSPEADFAWATQLWRFRATAGDTQLDLPVRCTWILEKQKGHWIIVHFHKSVASP
jgi:ketosteroid isomerase-like protein